MTLCILEEMRPVRRQPPIEQALRERAEGVLEGSYAFVASPIFRQRGIEAQLMDVDAPELPPIAWYRPTLQDSSSDKECDAPLLMKADQEKLMFYRFNFSKKRLQELQRKVRREGLTEDLAQELVLWHGRFVHYREYLVRTNLALVLAMAKRTRLGQLDFAELVSEGNMALLRTVDKFDADRGFKFSTYACRAILKAFFRTSMNTLRHRSRHPVEYSSKLEKSFWQDRRRATAENDSVDDLKNIVDRNLAELTKVERTVIRLRFNWHEAEEAPFTLHEVAQVIGRTKERVRQIQLQAMRKIRRIMDAGLPSPEDSAGAITNLAG